MRLVIRGMMEAGLFPALLLLGLLGRVRRKKFQVGLGPEPLINSRYHKQALLAAGYSAETFCLTPYYITAAFDVIAAPWRRNGRRPGVLRRLVGGLRLVWMQFTRYRCVFLSFGGGCLRATGWLWRVEPWLLRLAGVRAVILPYGSDVQDMACSPNLEFKHALGVDYPKNRRRRSIVRRKVDLWSEQADHVIGGCDWVDYMHGWDTLTLAHFTLDTDAWVPREREVSEGERGTGKVLTVLHAPNHRAIKGTQWLEAAIAELKAEGEKVELRILERVPNDQIKTVMEEVDVVADQFVIGWYAMFALEGMAMGKPVLCYCRGDLERLYQAAGLLEAGELPLVNCPPEAIKDRLRELAGNEELRAEYGRRGREFVEKHHSVRAMSMTFGKILQDLGLKPGA